MSEVCIVENCNSKIKYKNMCSKHYTHMRRHGRILQRTRHDENEIVTHEGYSEIIIYDIGNNEKCRVKIDTDKIKDIIHIKWHIDKNGYIAGLENGKQVKLHRKIMKPNKGIKVDHMNRDKLDNRVGNLRIVNSSQSTMNRGIQKNNSSGVTGVKFDEKNSRWIARIGVYNKQIWLGSFNTANEAIEARRKAEEKYHGEYAADYQGDVCNA